MFGGPVRLSYVEILQVLYNWRTLGFIALIAVAIAGADPHGYRGHMPVIYAFLLWQIGAIGLVLIKTVTFGLLSLLTARNPQRRIWLPLCSVVEFSLTLVLLLAMDRHVVDDSYSFDVRASFPFMMMTMLILELLYIRFLMASIIEPRRSEQQLNADAPLARLAPEEPAAPPPTIDVAGRRLRPENIRYICSEEHYIRVATRTEDIVARAKLGDVIATVAPGDGIRTHRSWWVSRHGGPVLRRANGKHHVELADGTIVPVARSRARQVQDWLDAHIVSNGG